MKPLFLYLGAETIPSQNPDVRFEIDHDPKHCVDLPDYDAIKPDARLKDPEKIEADLAAKRAKAGSGIRRSASLRGFDDDMDR